MNPTEVLTEAAEIKKQLENGSGSYVTMTQDALMSHYLYARYKQTLQYYISEAIEKTTRKYKLSNDFPNRLYWQKRIDSIKTLPTKYEKLEEIDKERFVKKLQSAVKKAETEWKEQKKKLEEETTQNLEALEALGDKKEKEVSNAG